MPPTNDQQVVNNVWASQPSHTGEVEFLTLPSGQTCHARRIGLEGMIEAGLLSESDTLLAIVDDKHIKRVRNVQGKNPKLQDQVSEVNAREIMKDPAMLKKIVFFVDSTMPVVVMDPVVRTHFKILGPAEKEGDLPNTELIPFAEREQGVVYTDQIGMEDKMFLFQYCVGGTRDLESFRAETNAAVAGVDDGEGVSRETQRPPRRRNNRKAGR